MSDRTPHLNRLLIFIIIILCLICGLLFTQSSAGPFGNSHTSVIAENTGDIAVLSSDKDQNIKLNISGTDISVSPSATPSPTPVKEQDAENVSPEAESGTWTADGTNWKFYGKWKGLYRLAYRYRWPQILFQQKRDHADRLA